MRTLYAMQAKSDFQRGAQVVARTSRGLEHGEILREVTDEVLAQMESFESGSIQRELTAQDRMELAKLEESAERGMEICEQHVRTLNLPMDLLDVELILGGERLTIYYLSEDRVDFRELVKLLQTDLKTRVELRHVGVRDEAKLLADYGDCGKPVCCNTHLFKMPPVTMRMAKLQKPSLDPNKISGRCGRLKCCLRYEFDTYEEHASQLPPVGSEIVSSSGRGRVLSQELLSLQLLVEMEDRRRILIAASDVLTVLKRGSSSASDRPRKNDSRNRDSSSSDEQEHG
jgi:cell fate regulator YaaT (PSP1 superfamily)